MHSLGISKIIRAPLFRAGIAMQCLSAGLMAVIGLAIRLQWIDIVSIGLERGIDEPSPKLEALKWVLLGLVLAFASGFAFYALAFHRRRRALERAEQARLRAIAREFPPRAFDASAIAPQIKRVRQEYAASAHQRWRPAYYRSELFAAARRFVTGLSYFRRTRHEHELHKHDA